MAVWESWLKKARRFTEYAEADLKNGRYDSCAFFAQQAVEMLLRGVLLKRTGARLYTHSLSEMVNIISQALQRETPEQVIRCAVKLEKHYLAPRYPDAAVSEYSKWDAEEAVECMREVFKYVRELGEDL